jgi:hypothetical protein
MSRYLFTYTSEHTSSHLSTFMENYIHTLTHNNYVHVYSHKGTCTFFAGMTPDAYSNMYLSKDVLQPWNYEPYDMNG